MTSFEAKKPGTESSEKVYKQPVPVKFKVVKTLITGGAGFIGSNLASALIERGDSVAIIDNLSTGKRENLEALMSANEINLVVGSILDRQILEPLVAEADLVYHLAAVVGVERVCHDPARTLQINIEGTKTLLELGLDFETPVVLASTSEIYGKNDDLPLAEGDNTILGPTTVPRWSYAVSKLADEHLALSLANTIPITIVRYFNCYGPYVDPAGYGSVVARFIDQALRGRPITIYGDGNQTRSFTYVRDSVDGTIAAALRSESDIFNIGCPTETTINELAARVLEMTESKSHIVHQPAPKHLGPFEDQRRRKPDITKAQRKLGFDPGTNLDEGLEQTIAWMRAKNKETLTRRAA